MLSMKVITEASFKRVWIGLLQKEPAGSVLTVAEPRRSDPKAGNRR